MNRFCNTVVFSCQRTFCGILIQRAAFGEVDPHFISNSILNAVQHSDIPGSSAVIVAPQHHTAVGIGSDHGQGGQLFGIQRQDAVVLQQHHGLVCSLDSYLMMLRGVIFGIGNLIVFAIVIEHTQTEPGCHDALAGTGDSLFRDLALFQRFQHVEEHVAAVQVTAVVQGQCGGLGDGFGDFMEHMEVHDSAAVGNHMALKSPLVPQGFLEHGGAAAGRLAVNAVIGAHNALYIALFDTSFKSRAIGFCQIFFAHHGVELMTDVFRTAVGYKMLGTGSTFQVFSVTLNSADKSYTQTGRQAGVLTISFVTAAPAGITENIHVGGPERQAFVDIPVAFLRIGVVLGAAFRGNHVADFMEQLLVERSCQCDGLRKHGSNACAGHTVKGLVPPVVLRNIQPGNCGSPIAELKSPLFNGHFPHQFFSPFHGLFVGHLLTHIRLPPVMFCGIIPLSIPFPIYFNTKFCWFHQTFFDELKIFLAKKGKSPENRGRFFCFFVIQ